MLAKAENVWTKDETAGQVKCGFNRQSIHKEHAYITQILLDSERSILKVPMVVDKISLYYVHVLQGASLCESMTSNPK
jgi:hypothetical protein